MAEVGIAESLIHGIVCGLHQEIEMTEIDVEIRWELSKNEVSCRQEAILKEFTSLCQVNLDIYNQSCIFIKISQVF